MNAAATPRDLPATSSELARLQERQAGHEKLCEERWGEASRQTQDFRQEMRAGNRDLGEKVETGFKRVHERIDEVHHRISQTKAKWARAREALFLLLITGLVGLIGWLLANGRPWDGGG